MSKSPCDHCSHWPEDACHWCGTLAIADSSDPVIRIVYEYLRVAPEQGDWPYEDHLEGLASGIVEALRSAGHLPR